MTTIRIAIPSCSNEVATLKVLRAYSTTSLGVLRQVIGTHEPALVFWTSDYSVEMEPIDGERQQQARILEAIHRLEQAGAVVKLCYALTPDDPFEVIDRTFLRNRFASDLEHLRRDRG